ncbi:DNA dependent ATPase [Kockovaella imperatae]|uniref:DNA dependent ATPase n=1 Tax=Kockovaella imperatae TaxID=4999 RepID=A0A1Y1UCI6_9TREE|nr:DNA dependent ATPase [Kockovaella imperatae]ORX35761.1 DNA dependent ATPase [Kockovaella imperatae]
MSRNRRQAAGVRGPASALTAFLAGLGVEPSAPLTTWGNSSAIPTGDDGAEVALASANEALDIATDAAEAVVADVETAIAGPSHSRSPPDQEFDIEPLRKRARQASIDSEDLDAPASPAVAEGPRVSARPLKAVGEFMDCGECTQRFTVTGYTKEHPSYAQTWLCVKCCWSLGIDPFEKAKKASKPKAVPKKDERNKIVHYEQRKGAVLLSEMCIELIGRCIEDVDQLGDIGSVNMDKVCRIISKNRQLTPETASLFYSVERTELTMYDCTRLVHDSYLALATLCPSLETLKLDLCGQITTEAMSFWSRHLKHLRRLELYGPFLVRKEGWHDLFKARDKQLQSFLVRQSPRIDSESIKIMAQYCPDLKELRLSEIGQLNDECLDALGSLKALTFLDLSSSGNPLSVASVDQLLERVGANLVHLDLSDNPSLGDETLESIAKHCPKLRHLRLRGLHDLSDDAVSAFFDTLSSQHHPGFETIDLEKGDSLEGKALRSLIAHSGRAIETLSLLGWRLVDAESVSGLQKCSMLKYLNLGWCRSVTDYCIKDILDSCTEIRLIKVWGCNQLTDAIPRKKGVRVIGIESHSIRA